MSKRAAVVGNSSFKFDTGLGAQIVDVLKSLGPDVTILTRARPEFDRFIAAVCVVLNVRCLTYDAAGGLTNLERDSTLIADCTELHAFLCLDDFEQGRQSGTGWLLEKALAADIPTFAYTAVDGALVHVGSPAEEGA